MTHYVYKTIFEDGYYYIGVRKLPAGFTPETDPYLGSGKALRTKLKRHLPKKQVVAEKLSKEAAYELEKQLVTYDTLRDPWCLNLVLGGRGGYLETVPLRKRWQRDTAKLRAAIEKTAASRRGKTKETDKALAAMAQKLSGRSKAEYAYLAEKSKKLSGRTKETHAYLVEVGRKISQKTKGRRKPQHAVKMRGNCNPSYRHNENTSHQLQLINCIPHDLYMRRHPKEMQDKVIQLAKSAVLRADIAAATGIPESTVNAFISKVLKSAIHINNS